MKKFILFCLLVLSTTVLFTSCKEEETSGTLLVFFDKPIHEIDPWLYVYDKEKYWTVSEALVRRRLDSGTTYVKLILNYGNYYVVYKDRGDNSNYRAVQVQAGQVTKLEMPVRNQEQ